MSVCDEPYAHVTYETMFFPMTLGTIFPLKLWVDGQVSLSGTYRVIGLDAQGYELERIYDYASTPLKP